MLETTASRVGTITSTIIGYEGYKPHLNSTSTTVTWKENTSVVFTDQVTTSLLNASFNQRKCTNSVRNYYMMLGFSFLYKCLLNPAHRFPGDALREIPGKIEG